MDSRFVQWLHRASVRAGFERDWYLIALGAVIGTITGLGAVGFVKVLDAFRDGVADAGESMGVWLILSMPIVGMALTGVLVHFWAPEAKGHGVPQVMHALIKKGGRIPARIGFIKVLASILTVGSGASAGTEGPIVQIGATAGSVVGQKLRIGREQMRTLVGCGAAAGIASIFNAPIAGVFFVMEIILRDFSSKTFAPIVVASVFSAVTTQALLGENQAIFFSQGSVHSYQFLPQELPTYILLGAICGFVAVGFNRLLHWGEDVYDRVRLHPLLKPITGAVLLGLLGGGFLLVARHFGSTGHASSVPAFFGNGYDTIIGLLRVDSYGDGGMSPTGLPVFVGMLALLVVFKAVATTLTLASGGSGGVFAPSLFLGATTGAAVGMALESLGLIPADGSPAAYALVGMAAVVAATTHAPLTAILILFEMTRDIYVVLPIMLAAIVATVVAQLIERDSIYTYKLRRAGIVIGRARDLTLLRGIPVSSCTMTPLPPEAIYPSDPLSKLITLHAHHHIPDFVVVDTEGRFMGMVTGRDIRSALIDREAIPLLLVAELLRTDLPTIDLEETLDTVMDKFAHEDVASLCVMDASDATKPASLLTRAAMMKRYQRALEES